MSFRSNPSGRPFLPPGNQCQIQGQGHSSHWMMMKAHQVAMVEPCCLIGHIDDVLMLETELDILYFRNHDVASVVAALQAESGTGTLASGVLRVWAKPIAEARICSACTRSSSGRWRCVSSCRR